MDFAQVVRRRRMIRRYRPDPVPAAALERILDAARRAPSAGFSQGQSFVVVTDAAVRGEVARACNEAAYVAAGHPPWVSAAPVHVIPCVCADDYRRRYAEPDKAGSAPPDEWDVPFWWVDGGAALMLLLLAAADEGLGAGLLAADSAALRSVLRIPAEIAPLGVVTVGYAEGAGGPLGSAARGRKPLEQVVHRERWSSSGQDDARRRSVREPSNDSG